MERNAWSHVESRTNDLGTIVCQHCDQVIATLPTEGVKTLYGICPNNACLPHNAATGGIDHGKESL
ncbi:hypothetical protein J31TS4_22810 [Paenibacillus sp. J31TS4]|uniref:GapA-binding peptide SR1P n=1 Tax=Paenibacillus sp. J31TS4 TaxID=2807195 RepID=UPI001B26B116|nr:GapA-binding peptide SR1P [Paenibacillus sp. J31TS4]GIP39001.1 hypothetical protein J31TS4_22810 [Paenibacillus sp. J31TS4]